MITVEGLTKRFDTVTAVHDLRFEVAAGAVTGFIGPNAAGKALSLGMKQRLAIGVALLGRPSVLILDEPLNGLDPEGIVWMLGVLTDLAAGGGTVLISSHLMNEMQETADHVVLIAAGRLVASLGMEDLVTGASGVIRVAGEDLGSLPARLTGEGASVRIAADGRLDVRGIDSRAIGRIALELGVVLDELSPGRGGLEQTFLDLTSILARVA